MGQLNLDYNFLVEGNTASQTNGQQRFFAFNVYDSISFNTVDMMIGHAATANTVSISLGLYSLTGNTLSIANTISFFYTGAAFQSTQFIAQKGNTSSAQNITPGTWYFGLLVSLSSITVIRWNGFSANLDAAFPGFFVG